MSAPFNEFGPFAVGEVCRIVGARFYPELIGREVVITGPCVEFPDAIDGATTSGYPTDLFHDGFLIAPLESHLRRKRPPQADSHERTFMQMWRDLADKAPQRVKESV